MWKLTLIIIKIGFSHLKTRPTCELSTNAHLIDVMSSVRLIENADMQARQVRQCIFASLTRFHASSRNPHILCFCFDQSLVAFGTAIICLSKVQRFLRMAFSSVLAVDRDLVSYTDSAQLV